MKETTHETINKMLEQCLRYWHVPAYQLAYNNLLVVQRRAGVDEALCTLVDQNIAMYVGCDYPPPQDFWEAINSPHHIIRNRLLAWWIDHPDCKEVAHRPIKARYPYITDGVLKVKMSSNTVKYMQ